MDSNCHAERLFDENPAIVGIGWSGAQPRAVTLMKYSGKAFGGDDI